MPGEDADRMLRGSMPFAQHLGIELDAASPQEVRAHLGHRAELCTVAGALHGGALMTLADSAGALCAFLNLPQGAQGTSTLESKTNLLRAVRGGGGPRRRSSRSRPPPAPPGGGAPPPRAARGPPAGAPSSSRPRSATTTAASSPRRCRRRPSSEARSRAAGPGTRRAVPLAV